MVDDELQCQECDWTGFESYLVWSEADEKSNKAASEIRFDLCPECGSNDICNLDEDD